MKYFATDGIRSRVGEGPMTASSVLHLGWAVGKVLASVADENNWVLIGKDTRISGYMFESALEAGFASAGVDVRLLGPMPTPAIAYLTRAFRAKAGIVISASHNSHTDNGLKFFDGNGLKIDRETELAIEEMAQQPIKTVSSENLGRASRITDAGGRYIEFCKSTFAPELQLNGLKIVVDAANGAAYDVAPRVFSELGAEVIAIGVSPDGLNINSNCGSTTPETLRDKVLEEKADLGIALDGDADRLLMVDHEGQVVDGDELVYIITQYYLSKNKPVAGVVGTLMSNLGLEHALQKLGIEFLRVPVGDRHVSDKLRQRGWLIGGEPSGHIICLDRSTTGDGIVAALQVLSHIVGTGSSLLELRSNMAPYPQTVINIEKKSEFDNLNHPKIEAAKKAVEHSLGNTGRVLIRNSGTEPVVRVMVEGRVAHEVSAACQSLASTVEEIIKATGTS